MHISITGDLGSGKSTVAKIICEKLNYKYLSTGQIQRQLALEKNMDTLEFNKYTDQNLEIDTYIDQKLKDINNEKDLYVLDSRLAWHFVKKSFKVYLMAIDEVAATRVLNDTKRIGEPNSSNLKSKIKELQERRTIENERFATNYGLKPSIFNDFDLIVDTSTAVVEDVTELILKKYKQSLSKESFSKIWLSPIRLIPTIHNINNIDDSTTLEVILFQREFYILKGHNIWVNAILSNDKFVPIKIILKNDNLEIVQSVSEVIKNVTIDLLKVWETELNFKYWHYPIF